MKFVDILRKKTTDNLGTRTPLIAFLGDSVTQGCFEVYQKDNKMEVIFDSDAGYPEKVKRMLSFLYPQSPVSVFNAGINGSSASDGYERLKRDVLCLKPDLLIVCFGLNDSNNEEKGISVFKKALRQIFLETRTAGIETIFMTPNMLNTNSSKVSKGEILEPLAEIFAQRQSSGVFDDYMEAAREVCREENVTLCDCYAIWKRMYECGIDTTRLLSNGLNHPVREMHDLFAWQLINTILND